MESLDWLRRRWGQMFCFGVGAYLLSGAGGDYGLVEYTLGGAALLLTGLGLRATTFWREANPPRPKNE